jgi:hypothetical protein
LSWRWLKEEPAAGWQAEDDALAVADGLVWRPMPDVPVIVGRSALHVSDAFVFLAVGRLGSRGAAGHRTVRQAAAFGIPDSILGEEVAAAVVLADGKHVTASELRSFAA